MQGMSGNNLVVPGHALHEKGLQRQIGVGTLVNSQQRRALAVSVINRGSTGYKPRVNRTFCSLNGLHRIPGHALHEKGLQRQIGVGTLVNSQQRRALAVPVINSG